MNAPGGHTMTNIISQRSSRVTHNAKLAMLVKNNTTKRSNGCVDIPLFGQPQQQQNHHRTTSVIDIVQPLHSILQEKS
jgi:hypothetical protein